MNYEQYVRDNITPHNAIFGLDTINPDRVDLLADTLFSGRIKKGTNYLNVLIDGEQRMCCLGVAEEMCITVGVDILRLEMSTQRMTIKGEFVSGNLYKYGVNAGTGTGILENKAREFYGFDSSAPRIPVEEDGRISWREAVTLNDQGPHGDGPEDTFTPTIAPAFRLLAKLARIYQAQHSRA